MIVIITTGSSSRTSYKPLFQKLGLLTLSLQYIRSLMGFLSHNSEIYTFNSIVHCFNTRNKLQLHKLSTTISICQKGAYYDSIKIFNKLPSVTFVQSVQTVYALSLCLVYYRYYRMGFSNGIHGKSCGSNIIPF
jgi:hypothetical protein